MLCPCPAAPAWDLEKEAGLLQQEAWHGSAAISLPFRNGQVDQRLSEPLSPALPSIEMSFLMVSWEHRDYRICKGNHWCKTFQYHWPPPFSNFFSHPPASFVLPKLQTRTGCQGTLWCSLEHGSWCGGMDSDKLIHLHSVEVL